MGAIASQRQPWFQTTSGELVSTWAGRFSTWAQAAGDASRGATSVFLSAVHTSNEGRDASPAGREIARVGSRGWTVSGGNTPAFLGSVPEARRGRRAWPSAGEITRAAGWEGRSQSQEASADSTTVPGSDWGVAFSSPNGNTLDLRVARGTSEGENVNGLGRVQQAARGKSPLSPDRLAPDPEVALTCHWGQRQGSAGALHGPNFGRALSPRKT